MGDLLSQRTNEIRSMMKDYVVYQPVVTDQDISGSVANIKIDALIRVVEASSQEEAIGKYILATRDMVLNKKLDVKCYEVSELFIK